MKRYLALLPVLLALVLVAGLRLVAGAGHPNDGPVYSVAQLRDNLRQDPRAWVGRPVLVRGVLVGCPHSVCPGHEPYLPPVLIDADHPESVDPLPLAWKGRDPVRAFLRRVPLLGTLVPAPQVPHWEAPATYRLQLGTAPTGACPSPPCYEALPLDAAPNSP